MESPPRIALIEVEYATQTIQRFFCEQASKRGYRVNIDQTWLHLCEKLIAKVMHSPKNLPEAVFFSAEEKVQLLSGNCLRNLNKERLKEWLLFRKGTAKDDSARSEATKVELSQRYKDGCGCISESRTGLSDYSVSGS